MENVSTIRKCQLCGKLLKRQDVGDTCKKCSAQPKSESDVALIETPEIAPINIDVIEIETVESEPGAEANINTDLVIPSEVLLETTTETTAPEEHKVAVFTLKPGQVIRDKFMELVSEDKITEEYIVKLSTKEGTAKLFGVRYPFLLEYDGTKSTKEQAYVNGCSRYTSKPIIIGDREYLITNDLYAKTVPQFMEWSKSLETKENN